MLEDPDVQLARLENGQLPLEEQRSMTADLGLLEDKRSEEVLLSLLGNADPITRYNAVTALGFDRGVRSAAPLLRSMLADDPDEDCRGASASALGQLLQNSNDSEAICSLALAALNDPDEIVRRSAYKAALIVRGISPEDHLALLRDESLTVDIERVRSWLSSGDRR